jgi:hypothetical protein
MKLSNFIRRSCGLIFLLCGLASAQPLVLRSVVLDAGGAPIASAGYIAGLSIGQTFASPWLAGTGYRAVVGFWHGPFGASGTAEYRAQSAEFGLGRCAPNPFRNSTTIRYSLATRDRVRLRVFDRNGRIAGTLVDALQSPGSYNVTWDIGGVSNRELPNGVYFLRLEASGRRASEKVVINR